MSDSANNRNTDSNIGNPQEVKPNPEQRYPLIEQSTEFGSMYINKFYI